MKFKVGDKVKAIHDKPKGMLGEIVEVNSGSCNDMYLCRFKGFNGHRGNGVARKRYCTNDHWFLYEEDIELIKEKPETIVIYRKENETIALDKRTGKKAVAKCCPEDTYDFNTGAKLAFDRLWLNNKYGAQNIREVKRIAKVGEYIKIVNPSGCTSDEYEAGDILKVIKVEDRGAYYKDELWKYAEHSEYVVLEGYEPEKQPYNGKIIFTKGDEIFKTGHIYEIKDGKIEDPRGYGLLPTFSHEGYDTFYSIEDVKDYFTASSKLHNGYGWGSHDLEFIEVHDD